MSFIVLRRLQQSELGWFGEIRRQGRETSRQRAINFDAHAFALLFPATTTREQLPIRIARRDDDGDICWQPQSLRRQKKNWRLTGDRIDDRRFGVAQPGDLFLMTLATDDGILRGAFDVLEHNNQRAQRILACPEAANLVTHGLVAFRATEAPTVAALVRELDPDLFGPFLSPDAVVAETVSRAHSSAPVESGLILPPSPGRMLQVLGNLGHSLPVALADLIDNSVSAGASNIAITFPPPALGHSTLAIVDDGKGMDRGALTEAMKFGTEREYHDRELGRFGIGLKAASFSQARTLTVASRTKSTEVVVLRWDEAHVRRSGTWSLLEPTLTPSEREAVLAPLSEHAGTAVLWTDLKSRLGDRQSGRTRKTGTAYGTTLHELAMHLGLVFHRFIEGRARNGRTISLSLNGRTIPAWNPFLQDHSDTNQLEHFAETVVRPDATGAVGSVIVAPFILPRASDLTDSEFELAGFHGRWNQMQGFYIYRADRVVQAGGWCNLWGLEEHNKLLRVAISFDPELDQAFQINAAKMSVALPLALAERLKERLRDARKEAHSRYRSGRSGGGKRVLPPPTPPASSPPGAPIAGGAPPHSPLSSLPPYKSPPTPAPSLARETDGSKQLDLADLVPTAILPEALEPVAGLEGFLWRRQTGMAGPTRLQVVVDLPELECLLAALEDAPSAKLALARLLGAIDDTLESVPGLQTTFHNRLRLRLKESQR